MDKIKRWRLVLGKEAHATLEQSTNGACALDAQEMLMDEALSAIYDNTDNSLSDVNKRGAGSGPSAPKVVKWLGDIRSFFKEDVVSVIQKDAIEKKGLKQLLFEPEVLKNIAPSIEMVATLITLKGQIPERTKDTARELVRAVVEEIKKRLENAIRMAVAGALNKRNHTSIPSISSIDWKMTIGKNLKNYNEEYKKILPERFYYFEKTRKANNWTVILDIDQSGSMAESVIYSSIAGAIFASIPSFSTRVVAFDTQIVDLTEQCQNDPVDMLFGIQLGGGTDINKSVAYCQEYITEPHKTLFFLITDLYEGGNAAELLRRLEFMKESGVKVICLLALSDGGTPYYDTNMAKKLANLGIPAFACTPGFLPELLEGALKNYDLMELAKKMKGKD